MVSSVESRKPKIRFKGFTDPWEQRKFSDLYVANNERNANCEYGYDRTLSIATMTFNGGNGASDGSLGNYKVIRVGDIAFEGHANKVHAYGRFVLNDAGDGLMSPRFSCLRPIVKQCYSFWKYYIPREETMRPILVKVTKSGTMMNELVPDDLMRESISVPCLAEQEVIGGTLTQLDHLITLHQRKLNALKNVKKSLLEKMFPKPGEFVPEIRFKGFTDPWEQRKLGDIAHTTIGEFVIRTKQKPNSPYPVYNGGTSYTGFYDEYNNEANQIVISARGANAGFVNIVRRRFWGGNSCYAVNFIDKENFDLDFTYQSIKNNQSGFIENQQAANIPSVSKSDVETFVFQCPKFNEQRQIGTFFAQLDDLITLHQHKLTALKNVKKSLLEKMFV